jgi:hypothetical protein
MMRKRNVSFSWITALSQMLIYQFPWRSGLFCYGFWVVTKIWRKYIKWLFRKSCGKVHCSGGLNFWSSHRVYISFLTKIEFMHWRMRTSYREWCVPSEPGQYLPPETLLEVLSLVNSSSSSPTSCQHQAGSVFRQSPYINLNHFLSARH